MEIDQVRSNDDSGAQLHPPVPAHALACPRFRRSDPAMYAAFHTGSPANIAQYGDPELDKLEDARAMADREQRIVDYCAVRRIINHEAIWFGQFQNAY